VEDNGPRDSEADSEEEKDVMPDVKAMKTKVEGLK
jgi:hypothetical protein